MGGGKFYDKSPKTRNINQECNMNSLYPVYSPDDFRLDSISLSEPKDMMRMIYTKSGFYSNETHGFFTLYSKSMEKIDVIVSWIPEHLIDPADIGLFIQLDGKTITDRNYPCIHLRVKEIALLSDIYSFYIHPPTFDHPGSIRVTLKSGNVLGSIKYSSQANWSCYDIIDILNNFAPIKSWENYLYIVGESIENMPQSVCSTESPHVSTSANQSQIKTSPKPAINIDNTINPVFSTIKGAQVSIFEKLSQVFDPITKISLTVPDLNFLNIYTNEQENNYLGSEDLERILAEAPELQGPAPNHTRIQPKLSVKEWEFLFDYEGKLKLSVPQVKRVIFSRGLCQEIRAEAWKFLLGVFSWDSTKDERDAVLQSEKDAYYQIKASWFNNIDVQLTDDYKGEKHMIDKDVHRTDRSQAAFEGGNLPNPNPWMAVGTNFNLETLKDILVTYNFYNTELGYIQGMSDILSPMFVIMKDEAHAFWCFSHFMNRLQSNFYIDQSGMLSQLKLLKDLIQFMDPTLYGKFEETESTNLLFCFRWLLVWFKREFEWEDVMDLWEVLWTDFLTDKMVLFIALAILENHRDKILNDFDQFDEILRYINDLSSQIDLKSTLERAEILYYQFERKINAMQNKSIKIKEELQERSVWNSPRRIILQEDIKKLQIPKNLLTLKSK